MTAPELTDLAARVVAWHNRHPLALRIHAAQVQGVGWVSLPFAGTAAPEPDTPPAAAAAAEAAPAKGATLRERAMAQPSASGGASPPPRAEAAHARQRAFDERFIEPWRPRQIARFAARHGRLGGPIDADQPLRDVQANGAGVPDAGIVRRYLRTAAVEAGDRRSRVLLAPDGPAIWGGRLWDRRRMTVFLVLVLLALAAVLALVWPRTPAAPGDAAGAPALAASSPVLLPSPAASAGSAPAAASAPAVPPVPASAPTVPALPPSQPAAAGSASATAVAPAKAPAPVQAPSAPAGGKLDIRPRLTPDQAREARAQSNALRAAGAEAASTPAPAARAEPPPRPLAPAAPARAETPGQPAAAAVPAPPRPSQVQVEGSVSPATRGTVLRPVAPPRPQDLAPGAKVFALVARPTRTRAASEVLLGLMQGAVVVAPGRRIEVLPVGEDWRATWWPFATRRDAEQAQAQLATLGLPVEVVEF